MNKPKVAIIGADGQLGFDLVRAFGLDFEVIKFVREDFDVIDMQAVEKAIAGAGPSLVVNTAAFHDTEGCERDPEKSFLINAIGAWNVARAAKAAGAGVMYISTDYVFDGRKPFFKEEDRTNPLNVYGASKLAGEALTQIANPNTYIVRTSWLYGSNPSHKGYNFVSKIISLAGKDEQIRIVDDQIGAPTYTLDLARKIKELIQSKAPGGIYHITNQGSVSWHGFAKKILEMKGIERDIVPITTAESISYIKRPLSSILANDALTRSGINSMRPWTEALEEYFNGL